MSFEEFVLVRSKLSQKSLHFYQCQQCRASSARNFETYFISNIYEKGLIKGVKISYSSLPPHRDGNCIVMVTISEFYIWY